MIFTEFGDDFGGFCDLYATPFACYMRAILIISDIAGSFTSNLLIYNKID